MSIQILPARLANQIAAGEVVERPASVVKELVENSLDAGATQVQIDIERGGHKLIRIRDNGSGINKDELALALSRHATSKLKTLDDLENICSLGFRGEALASISSVSRLCISSKPKEQKEAWQAFAEGRDMAVKVQPTAHPDGTTIEVVDLFFNTPARRKFLRTEKTEFNHIDELLKRIALSRFDVAITLKHNGKSVRQYRAQKTVETRIKRIAQVAGPDFLKHALYLESGEAELKLFGWVLPFGINKEPQYTYVNGRMMRDKLILHAIRQAFEEIHPELEIPAFVLYLEINPQNVDVNVHPAKHEVRFHQARLVHDFIFQGVKQLILNMSPEIASGSGMEHSYSQNQAPDKNHYDANPHSTNNHYETKNNRQITRYSDFPSASQQNKVNEFYQGALQQSIPDNDNAGIVNQNLTTPSVPVISDDENLAASIIPLVDGSFVYTYDSELYISHFKFILHKLWLVDIENNAQLMGKPLLLPVRISMQQADLTLIRDNISWLNILGYDFKLSSDFLMVKKLPEAIYAIDVNKVIDNVLLVAKKGFTELEAWLHWQANWVSEQYFSVTKQALILRFINENIEIMAELIKLSVKIDLTDYTNSLKQLTNRNCII